MRSDLARIHAVLVAGAGGQRQPLVTLVALATVAAALLPAVGIVVALEPTP